MKQKLPQEPIETHKIRLARIYNSKVKQTNVAILMVEQNAKQALSISDRGYVLVTGENKYSGTGKELLNDPRVRSSFLGG